MYSANVIGTGSKAIRGRKGRLPHFNSSAGFLFVSGSADSSEGAVIDQALLCVQRPIPSSSQSRSRLKANPGSLSGRYLPSASSSTGAY